MTDDRRFHLIACALCLSSVSALACGEEPTEQPESLRLVLADAAIANDDAGATDDAGSAPSGASDALYVGELTGDSIKRFDATTGASLGAYVASGAGGLAGPRGLLSDGTGRLLVASQSSAVGTPGAVLAYDAATGAFTAPAIPTTDPHAPYNPQAIVSRGGRLIVADLGEPSYVLDGGLAPNPTPARISVYDSQGAWERDLPIPDFDETCEGTVCTQWAPRAIVFGPDGAIYASLMHYKTNTDTTTLPGRVIRITDRGVVSTFVDANVCGCGIARPQGLVFGPDDRLYVTSYRLTAADSDKILIFDGASGVFLDQIELSAAGATARSYATGLVFGPEGRLFVSTTGTNILSSTIRAYDIGSKQFEPFVPAGAVFNPSFLIFGRSNPATLSY